MSERMRIAERASGRCEYCLYPEAESLISYHLDHVVAKQHGGADDESNLALCCAACNRYKGPNLTSLDPKTKKVTQLYNPRTQQWTEHFALDNGRIEGVTATGRVTTFLLRFNDEDKLAERRALIAVGRY